jgi:hypothetical protein
MARVREQRSKKIAHLFVFALLTVNVDPFELEFIFLRNSFKNENNLATLSRKPSCTCVEKEREYFSRFIFFAVVVVVVVVASNILSGFCQGKKVFFAFQEQSEREIALVYPFLDFNIIFT